MIHRADQQITDDLDGYIVIDLSEDGYGCYFAHDLAFLHMTGEWPKSPVIHLDGNKSNNAWANLRESHTQ